MDAIDSGLLRLLGDNGRASFSALGRGVGLSANAAAARVRRLEEDGIIAGYTVRLADDLERPAEGLEVFIDVRLRESTGGDAFLAYLKPLAQVRDAVHVTGPYDYLLHVRVRNPLELDGFLHRLKHDGGAAQTQTRIALRHG
ncbi:Lrp/AsnC family transcriptional regulator [Arthrobacter sp. 35W]|uniref:Lrp/AsnC family transcriptional regulator n=1 Tax=Arthrobacter sp. 35W TaxID=1132441 RepID=UPI0004192607|nr:Lrp/AsnC family transcriptional regulator [Arthrobacter sp. 35W]